ncbi:PKD domain-containing protein [Desulfopila aestuarii]|uniref:PKD repeat-containing protein n=1 Tax=Desulfopila aestuarii DSM 18488 TaxID=1121416 RepID=A0A1M7YFV2_9BACT|nr:PKD domain-containing protein [Desulfopila aestuarii]SHO51449.1 PKD repeat-containing protein [Desulfopila aestuarii DSM 18488]
MDSPKIQSKVFNIAITLFIIAMALCSLPPLVFAGQLRVLEVNISFDISALTNSTLSGYNLYEDSVLVCETNDPVATTLSCGFVTENGTHSYALTARYSDGTESPKSEPFQFTISDPEQLRTLEIALTFESSSISDSTQVGYRLYEDSQMVCETSDPGATTISCSFATTDGTHSYQLAAYFADGTESQKSPPFEFSIGETNQLNSISLAIPSNIEILDQKTLVGYVLFIDSALICQTTDPAATSISCLSDITDGIHTYEVSAYYTDGTVGQTSPPIQFTMGETTIGDISQLRTLEIALTFDAAAITDTSLAGYRLFEDSQMVCETSDPGATTISCSFATTDGTHSYQLAAYFADGTESPKSPPFEFSIGETNQLNSIDLAIPSEIEIIDGKTLAGYKLFIDSSFVCQTTDPAATSISCLSDITDGIHTYEVSAYYTDGTVGQTSPPIQFTIGETIIGDTSQLRTLEIALTFDAAAITDTSLAGYRLFEDSQMVCETNDPGATTISCSFATTDGTHSYQLAAYYVDGTESPKSPPFEFSIGETNQLNSIELAIPSDIEIIDGKTLAGYKLFIDSSFVCQTTTPTATTISCLSAITDGTHIYQVSAYYTDGTEGQTSSAIQFTIGETSKLRSLDIALSFDPTAAPEKTLAGYKLFEDSLQVCITSDPTATSITCQFITANGTHTYELAAHYTDGTDSLKSPPFEFTISDSPSPTGDTTENLVANIAATPISGTAPLTVSFNAANSTGNIITYSWDFGDGDTGTGTTPTHTYSIPGTYTASILVHDTTGNVETTSTIIQVNEVISQSVPPAATITSSVAAGEAPLAVTFDGSASTAINSTIVSYEWDFGDGSTGSGDITSHVYTAAGTYSAALLVTDSQGLTDNESTPIVVTPTTIINQPPSASFTASPSQGASPLTAIFDASSSQDPDGTITSYSWNFGDGTTGSGKSVQHIYTNAATYTATLQVTDDGGASSPLASKSILVEEAQPTIILNYEIGELNITNDWVRVIFENSFTNPAVFISPPTNNDKDATVTRVRNLDKTGFEIRLQEWDYLDGKHLQETVSFIALEQGQATLPDGTAIEIGSFNGTTRKQTISFRAPFTTPPVVLTTIVSENETDAVTGRINVVTKDTFSYLLQEQESKRSKHVAESVSYLAWSTGSGSVDNIYFSAQLPTTPVTDKLTSITFLDSFNDTPFLFIEAQTMNSSDTGALRIQDLSTTKVDLFFQEEQAADSETNHSEESVGFITILPTTIP